MHCVKFYSIFVFSYFYPRTFLSICTQVLLLYLFIHNTAHRSIRNVDIINNRESSGVSFGPLATWDVYKRPNETERTGIEGRYLVNAGINQQQMSFIILVLLWRSGGIMLFSRQIHSSSMGLIATYQIDIS